MVAAVEYRFGQVNRLPVTIEWLSDNGSCHRSPSPATEGPTRADAPFPANRRSGTSGTPASRASGSASAALSSWRATTVEPMPLRTGKDAGIAASRSELSSGCISLDDTAAERRETFGCSAEHPVGVPSAHHKTRVNALMTRHARRLRGALRPMTRDARLSALHRGDFSPGAAVPAPA
jgi:hypothetical protein